MVGKNRVAGKIRLPFLLFFLFSVFLGVVFLLVTLKKRGSHGPTVGMNLHTPPPVVSEVPRQEMVKEEKQEEQTKTVKEERVSSVGVGGGVLELTNLDYEIARLEKQKKIEELKQELRALRSGGTKGRDKGNNFIYPSQPSPPPLPSVVQPPVPSMQTISPIQSGGSKEESDLRKGEEEGNLVVERILCSDMCVAYVNIRGNVVRVKKGDSVGSFFVREVKEDGVVVVGKGGVREVRVSYSFGTDEKKQDTGSRQRTVTGQTQQSVQFNRVVDVKR